MWRRTTWICLRRMVFGAAGLLVMLATLPVWAEPAVSLESLLSEMIDRERIATVPAPHYVCRQFSSYDRDTVGKDQPGWFANWDRSQFVRVEETGRTQGIRDAGRGRPGGDRAVLGHLARTASRGQAATVQQRHAARLPGPGSRAARSRARSPT